MAPWDEPDSKAQAIAVSAQTAHARVETLAPFVRAPMPTPKMYRLRKPSPLSVNQCVQTVKHDKRPAAFFFHAVVANLSGAWDAPHRARSALGGVGLAILAGSKRLPLRATRRVKD